MNFPLPYLKYQDSYELEYKITDVTVIESLLNRLDLEFIEFVEDEVITYKSIINTNNVVYRSVRPISTTANSTQVSFYETGSKELRYEKKELLYKIVNNVEVQYYDNLTESNKTKFIQLSLKLSKETPTDINYNPIELIYKRARLSYYIKNSNIRFDITYRYYPVNNDINLYKSQRLKFSDLIVKRDNQNSFNETSSKEFRLFFPDCYNCKLVVDGEFEVSNKVVFNNSIDSLQPNHIDLSIEHTRLMCLLSNHDYFIENKILKYSPFDYTRTPQVNVFTTLDIQSFNYNDYVWSEKIDGIRTLVIIFEGKLLSYRTKTGINFISSIDSQHNLENLDITIIDTEYTEYNNTYHVFDVYSYDGVDVRSQCYEERIMSLNPIMNNLTDKLGSMNLKILQLNSIQSYQELVNHILTQNENTDGIVLHNKDKILTKWKSGSVSYKVKTKSMSTVDFLFKYMTELDCYYLYLSGNNLILDSVVKYNSKFNTFILDKKHMILFDSPYFKDSFKYQFNQNDVNKLFNTSVTNKKCLDNLVIECKYENRWVPIRIREDKIYPNGYVVGLTNSINIFYPLEEYVESDEVELDDNNSNILMMLVQKYKDYFNMNQGQTNTGRLNRTKLNVIDYDGTISTNKNILDCDVSSLFVINSNKLELIHYVQETFKYNLERNTSNQYKITNEVSTVNLNVFEKTNDLINNLLSCDDFIIKSVNIILVNDINSIDAQLFKTIKSYCNIDAKILYVYNGYNFKEDVFDKYKHDILTTIEYKNQYGIIMNC